jgi:hypothetical protein
VPVDEHAGTAEWVGAVWEAVMVRDTEPPSAAPPV